MCNPIEAKRGNKVDSRYMQIIDGGRDQEDDIPGKPSFPNPLSTSAICHPKKKKNLRKKEKKNLGDQVLTDRRSSHIPGAHLQVLSFKRTSSKLKLQALNLNLHREWTAILCFSGTDPHCMSDRESMWSSLYRSRLSAWTLPKSKGADGILLLRWRFPDCRWPSS